MATSSEINPVLNFQNITDIELQKICEANKLSITLEESQKIVKMLGRNPTLTEATIWSIQGSEHSSYKSSRQFLSLLPTDATPVILGPKEDAGIVELCEINGEKYGLVYSHESHNSPSQLVPFEGAATGVGGICRDIACMGARVIGVLDQLRFGNHTNPKNQVIARGVVEGVAGYGNPLGVPNMGGDIAFDESFDGFTLVNVVALGLVKEKNILHSYAPENAARDGYNLIVVGKGSDKSGFGGASFSSQIVNEDEKEKNLGAVQEPNPFLERHLLASFQDLFKILEEKGTLNTIGFKDMGAGGIMCASVEIAEGNEKCGFGAEVHVENIHVGEENLLPHVILCSETQERFCFAVPPEMTEFVLDHFNKKWDLPKVAPGAKASNVGTINDSGRYTVKYKGEVICDANIKDITEGLKIDRPYTEPTDLTAEESEKIDATKIENLSGFLYKFLSRPNCADRTCVTEQYDQTVQGSTVLDRSESDAVVAAPLRDFDDLTETDKLNGFAVSIGGSAHLGGVSAFQQGANAVTTAIQRVAATGAYPRSLTDCLNYGNPELEEDMGKFVSGVKGVAESAKNIHLFEHQDEPTPFISGNVSLYKKGNPSAIVSCVGSIKDVNTAVGNVPKAKEIAILIGDRPSEIGGTEFAKAYSQITNIPTDKFAPAITNYKTAEENIFAVLEAHKTGLISSASVVAEGGLANTFLQKCIRGNVGFTGDFSQFSTEELFSEGNGFLVSVTPSNQQKFLELMKKNNVPTSVLGRYLPEKTDAIDGKIFTVNRSVLVEGWSKGLRGEIF